jgi:hypothetical protein
MPVNRVCICAVVVVCAALQTQRLSATPIISVSSVTANVANNLNTPAVLAADATNYEYVTTSAGGGGGGTSWHTTAFGTTPVDIVFNFGATSSVTEFSIWDYYGHTPTLWTVKMFAGAGATGTELLSYDFSIGASGTDPPDRWYIDVADTSGVSSVLLRTRNNSQFDGVGLSEVMFVPEPSSLSMLVAGLVALLAAVMHRRTRCSS